MQKKLYGQLAA